MAELSTPADALAAKRQQLMELMLRQKRKTAESARNIPRRGGEEPVLSFGQRRLWFIEQLQPGSAAYNVPGAVRIRGRLDLPVLETCLREVGRRHETLRTSIRVVEGEPRLVIAAEPRLRLVTADLRGVPAAEREEEARRLIGACVREPFDLASDPLARTILLRLGDEEHLFLLLMHHAICDVWSIGVFFRNTMALYDAFTLGLPSPLPELPVQYPDYALWQQRLLRGENLEKLLAFWKEQLADAPFVLELPTDLPRPAEQTFRGGQAYLTLDAGLTEGLRALGAQHEASLYMTLMAALDVLLFRYTGQETILVGIPAANRNRVELEGMIGLLLNTLVVRADLAAGMSFRRLLAGMRERILGSLAHQELPFERLVEELRIERDMSRNPVYQVMFTFQNVPSSAMTARDLELARYEVLEGTSRDDLELNLRETGEGLAGWLAFDAGLFEPSTAARMTGHLRTLLAGILTHPDLPLSELPLMSGAELQQVRVEWNDTARPQPPTVFTELFGAWVERTPEATAAACEGITLTYRELDERARGLAARLPGLGVVPGDLVALLDRRGLDLLAAILGVMRAGAAYIPLDPEHPPHRHAQVLGQSGAALVLAAEDLLPVLDGAAAELADPPRRLSLPALLARAGEEEASRRGQPADLAYTIFTSGSTGLPKGAMVTQGGMVNHLRAKIADLGLDAADAVAQTASQCFDISVWQFLAPLAVGGRVHVYPDEVAHDPGRLLAAVDADGVTVLETVPSLLRMMVEEADRRGAGRPFLAGLRWVVPTGEALPPELCGRWLAAYPGIPLVNAYGPTECSDDVAHHPVAVPPASQAVRVPIGRAVVNTRLYVVDRGFQPAPIGVAGELCVGGAGVGRGYLNSPERTAAVFVPDPFGEEPGARLYRTGDLVRRLADGSLDFLGRIDHQVKVRGFRIELGEIEAVLMQHPAVRQAVVLAQEAGAADRALIAYTVAGPEVDDGTLRAFLASRLPDYMVPAAFVLLADLPLTANGKVDRRALLALAPGFAARGHYVAPRSPVEESLAAIWAEVLKVPRVGVEDDFFELGGQSLLATQVISRVREAFMVELPVRLLFQQPRVAALAEGLESALLRAQGMPAAPPMGRVERGGELPLSFAQERLWFIDRLRPGMTVYNIFGAVRMSGELDVATLERSFSELTRRHEVLRTTFATAEGRPVQVVNPPAAVPIPVVDLRAIPGPERSELAARLSNQEAQRPFDLVHGPLIRGVLLRVSDGDHLLAVTAHHIVYDVWSREILIRELGALYEAFWHGRPSPLPELAIQYADFAVWQRGWMQGEVLEAQLSYWTRQLAGVTTGTELPGDRPRPPVQSFRGARTLHQLTAETTVAVKDLSRRQGVTLFMALLAGFNAFLARTTGEDDLVIGSPIANRNRAEIEPMIGFFVNTQVLRTQTAGDPTFRELLGRVREVALGAYSNQDLAFEHLVKTMKPPRDTSRQPLFQILFNFLTNYRPIHMELPGVTLTPERNHSGAVQFDLVVTMYEVDGRLYCSADYSTDLFDRATVDRMMDHFSRLLAAGAADPGRRLSELSMRPEEQRQQILVEWNDTREDFAAAPFLHQVIAEWAERKPDAPAVSSEDGCLTWRELAARAERLARRLRILGAGPDTLVGLHLERSADLVVGVLGVLQAGAAYLPLDPSYPGERLAYALRDAGVPLLVTHRGLSGRLSGHGAREVPLEEEAELYRGSLEPAALGLLPDHLAYVIYTSGSTGWPKGVMIPHRGLVNYLLWAQRAYAAGDGAGAPVHSTIGFDLTVTSLLVPLAAGTGVTLLDERRPVEALLAALREAEDFSLVKLTPAHLDVLGRELLPGEYEGRTRALVIGGEALRAESVAPWREHAPRTRLFNEYGPTEATVGCSVREIVPGDPTAGPVSIGRPIANARFYVIGPDLLPVPFGVPGELWIGGDGLARGYLGRPELTATKFVPDGFGGEPGARLYRTGDLVRFLPDGEILFLGRTDQQVKVRGYRIELEEIETVLRVHPGVRDAAVVAVAGESAGGSRPQRLVAFLVLADEGREPEPQALRAFLRERLPEYMVPTGFGLLPALPLTPNGKVDRRALARAEGVALAPEVAYTPPRTATEATLAGIWSELLQVERVGIHDNFFDLGGHSLLTTQLASRLRDAFELEVPLQAFFEEPTVAGLAESIEVARWAREVAGDTPVPVGAGELEEGEL
jgi:amino acid adenylation domain-containing protein